MNFPQNLSDIDYKFNQVITSSKNSINQEILKAIPSNQMTINFSKDESNSNSIDIKNNKLNSLKQKRYISTNQNEAIENDVEEEEVNSDEYVSSTMLDVDTNTYIRMSNDSKNLQDKICNKINDKKLYQGKLRKKDENKSNTFMLNDIQNIEKEQDMKIIRNNTNVNNNGNGNGNSHDINSKKIIQQRGKNDVFIINRPDSINKEKKNNSKDKKGVFTPVNENKNKFKILRDMIFKKIDHGHNKNVYSICQSNTINILDNNEDNNNNNNNNNSKQFRNNNLLSINNDIIKEATKINLDLKNKRNKNSLITHNNSISILSNNISKNTSIKSDNYQHQNMKNNHKKYKINLYNKNLMKDIGALGALNIDDQKYQVIPQTIKKIKTQGRVGKIVYSNQNKRNNFIYISNNITNKTINSPMNKKINRISPPNRIDNVEYFNSICHKKNKRFDENILKHNNIHSLKNLKSESLHKSIKKYILDDEYLTIFPLNTDKNGIDKQKKLILKDSKNKKLAKNQIQNRYNEGINIKSIISLNNTNKKNVRNVNSCYNKKVLNYYQSEQTLNTISNHNKKPDLYNNFKNNYNEFFQNKNGNVSNKKITNEKMHKNRELSFNLPQDSNSIKNILSLKKIKNLKNKFVLQNIDLNVENGGRNTSNFNTKKNKPLTTRIKLDLVNEEMKNNSKKNNLNYILNNNNSHVSKNNSNSSTKKIIYIDNSNYKHINSKSLMLNSVSPNCQSIKQLVNKTKIYNMKEMCNNMNFNNQGRNSYNIYAPSKINYNLINLLNSNNSNNSSSNNKVFYKKIQKDNVKIKRSNGANTINYNNDNITDVSNSNQSAHNKKIIVFNNVNNYNINRTNNTLNNIPSIRNDQINSNVCKKTLEILSPFSSLNNNIRNSNHKKFYIINKQGNNPQVINSKMSSKEKKNNIGLTEQNYVYLDGNRKNKAHVFNGVTNSNNSNSSNKYLYKNKIYNLNDSESLNNNNYYHNNVNSTQISNVMKINNNANDVILDFPSSNEKERNTMSNKSYGNLIINRRIKNDRDISLDLFEKIKKNNTKKSISPVQELKNKF